MAANAGLAADPLFSLFLMADLIVANSVLRFVIFNYDVFLLF